MSVRGARTGGIPDQTGFEELEHQEVSHTFRLTNPNSEVGANGSIESDRVDQIEPAGGLERGEWAELVYLNVYNHEVLKDQPNNTEPTEIRSMWELSFDDVMRTGNLSPDMVTKEQSNGDLSVSRGDSTSTNDALVARDRSTDKWEVLYHNASYYLSQVYDSASGSGAGGHHGQSGPVSINYRQMMGGGPVVSSEDELYQHFGLNLVECGNDANIVTHVEFALGWDVFTVD